MSYEQRDDTASVFKAKPRENASENAPNLDGAAKIGGVEYWVSGWTKTTKGGDKWIWLSFKRKDAPKVQKPLPAPSHTIPPEAGNLDDSLPF